MHEEKFFKEQVAVTGEILLKKRIQKSSVNLLEG